MTDKHRLFTMPVTAESDPGYQPRHRANVQPDARKCLHPRFMRDCRRTEVPDCWEPVVEGSLYCTTHDHH